MKKSPFSISAEELKHSLETAKKFPQTTDWTGEIYRKLEGVVQFEHLSFKIDIESKKLRVIPRLKLYMINDPEYTYSTYSELSYFYKFRERILRRGIVTRKVGTESAEELPPPSESASWIEEFEPFPVNFGTEENPNFHMVFTHEEKLNAVEFSILKQKRRESWESDS
jgi:hypothetical protein